MSTSPTTPSSTPSVLCPVDFSDASRGALVYATAIAAHFGAALTILTIDDPLIAAVVAGSARGPGRDARTEQELRHFAGPVLEPASDAIRTSYLVAVGEPAPEILALARQIEPDLIVMGSHGLTGMRKLFFGSTTERVLRETTVPVLVTPDEQTQAVALSELKRRVRQVLAPVDFSPASAHQVTVAAAIAAGLTVPLILAHVTKPGVSSLGPGQRLSELAASTPAGTTAQIVVAAGKPSEEIAALAETGGSLVVMGLHSSGLAGPRMGSVTYGVLCRARTPVLALPPPNHPS
jgi:universal stress protein A